MKRFFKVVPAVLIIMSLAACSIYAKEKTYVTTREANLIRLLSPPPAEGSKQAKEEIDEILAFQKTRTNEAALRASADQEVSVFRFADTLGKNFTKEKLPVTAEFFKNILNDEFNITEPAKSYWKRRRPSAIDGRVKPCVRVPLSASYPSGHSTAGNLMAIILADMVPEKSTAIYDRGREFALNRIIAGVHYRSDVESGRIAAAVIAAFMFNNPEFKEDYEASKAEVRSVLGYDK